MENSRVAKENREVKKSIDHSVSTHSDLSCDVASRDTSLETSFTLAYRRVADCLQYDSDNPLRQKVRAVSLSKRTLVLVEGKDAIAFLDGLTSNDLASAVRSSCAITTVFLTPQGAISHLCLAIPVVGGVILECEHARFKDFATQLWQARMDSIVTFRWLRELSVVSIFPSEPSACVETDEGVVVNSSDNSCENPTKIICLNAEMAEAGGFLFKDPRAPMRSWRLYHARANDVVRAVGFPEASLSDYEGYRLSLGIVENGEELAQPRAFPFEYGLDALAALDWQKACYVGQEITARMKYRGRETKKHALALRVASGAVAVQRGDKVYCGTQEEGLHARLGKLCGEILYVVDSANVEADVEAGTGETTVLALCQLARLREEVCKQETVVDSVPLTIAAGSGKGLRNARLLLPRWLATLFLQKSLLQKSPLQESPSQESSAQGSRAGSVARASIAALMVAMLFCSPSAWAQRISQAQDLQSLRVQAPYRLSIFARAKGARSLAVAEEIGSVFVSTRGRRLYVVKEGKTHLLADNLNVANGIVWRSPYLYIVEQDKVSRHRFDAFQARLPKSQEHGGGVLFAGLPNKRHHGWRVATIGPDRRLYIALGAPCNVCSVTGLEGTIIRMALDGSGIEVYASGIRNSIGMDFQPSSGTLFFTDNGADFMGDNSPPEEVNHALRKGMFFGYPWFGGGRDRTKEFATRALPKTDNSTISFPITTFTAHSAPLGIHFYRGEKFKDLKGDAFVALHGSWNRSAPVGYKVMRLQFATEGSAKPRQSVFIDGFLQMRGGRGRPVDIKTHWDGSLLISDDARGLVYRIDRNE